MRWANSIVGSDATVRPVASLLSLQAPLGRRIGSALVMGPPALACAYIGGLPFAILIGAILLILVWEWSRLCGAALPAWGGLALLASLLIALVLAVQGNFAVAGVILAIGAVVALLSSAGNAWLAAGAIYLGVPGLALLWLRQDPEWGRLAILWLLAVVWASDIGAYAAGSTLGGPRLAPRISPNKTWSGLCGGVGCAALVGAVVAALSGSGAALQLAAVSAGIGFVAQMGDLAESWLKRRFGVKDVSGLIPGHGGMLDRVDGLLVAAMATALIAVLGNGKIWIWL
ncbi:phosphatidate cytidylyltransferase [Defluviicoccus vanus]|uniref:Phosphatidate cytidylyltransferase n=1 Tax=Defluviicoccus vanus TaxID=111831 RepID=A0A7H1N4P5_9PROT|nr:CDP-archaeol synthase [Defluviicoccus vanus]QNT70681.1 CDP-archaeol synthase [Defluviicoccus vanus]